MNETAGMISFREKAILFYKRLEYLIRPLFRFAVALALLLLLRRHLGAYGPANAMLQNTLLNVIIALACSMVPPGYAAAIVALVMVWDLYALSLEAAAICAALLLLCILLYFRFSPRDTIVMLLMPIAYAWVSCTGRARQSPSFSDCSLRNMCLWWKGASLRSLRAEARLRESS